MMGLARFTIVLVLMAVAVPVWWVLYAAESLCDYLHRGRLGSQESGDGVDADAARSSV